MAPETSAPELEAAPYVQPDTSGGPNPGEVIVTYDLCKVYEMGDQEVNALCGINLRVCRQ